MTPLGSIVDPEVYWRNRILDVWTNGSSPTVLKNSSVTIQGRLEM
jgi:hypothetical protein